MKKIILLSISVALFAACTSDIAPPDENSNKSMDELFKEATQSLENEQWDEAINYYNAAYNRDNNNPGAIIYSTLANLAKISTDPKVVALMKSHFGFTTYPDKLNALLSDTWMKEYDDISLPVITTPEWVKGNGSMYDDALVNNVMSIDNFAISLIANVITKNSTGFNGLLDEVIDGVFGASYNEAVNRLKRLENRKEERIHLDPYFIEKFELEEIFDEYDQIGWAEVNAVLSVMLAVKASLEWVQTYDLSIDLNWLKFAWSADEDQLEQDFLNKFKALADNQLPFNNNFLKARSGKTMATPKATYGAAIKGLQASYASIKNSNLYPSEVKDAYPAINDGFEKLIAAINAGGKFYIPEENPTKISAWPTTNNNAQATIDLGKIFTPGYFSLNKIFETDASGKPVFYLEKEECHDGIYYYDCDYNYVKLDKSNYAAQISNGGRLSLKVNVSYIASIADIDKKDGYVAIGFKKDHAKTIVEKYYK